MSSRETNLRSLKVGWALSGGGIRGLAHIGVLKVLEREQCPIHVLAGTSMGGFIGALYATGRSAAELEAEALRLSSPRQLLPLLELTLPRRGLFHVGSLTNYINRWLGGWTFDQLRFPLALVAVDLHAGEKVVLQEGSLSDAVQATTAVPGLLGPLRRGEQLLVDGGVVDNLPADVARELGADVVVAVDVSTDEQTADLVYDSRLIPAGLADMINVLWRTVVVMTQEANRRSWESGHPELLIRPAIPSGVSTITGLTQAGEIIAAGELAMEEALPQLRDILGAGTSPG
jgi:NTE family protein